MQQSGSLSNIQLELLKLYQYNLSESQLVDIKRLLAQYFAKEIDEEIDQLWDENAWNKQTIKNWKNTHMRTPYQSNDK